MTFVSEHLFSRPAPPNPPLQEHMLKHGINGYMFCNMPQLNFTAGDK